MRRADWGVGVKKVTKILFGILGAFILFVILTLTPLKSFFNPVTRLISFETQKWGTFVTLTPRAFKTGETKNDVHRRLIKNGFTPTTLHYHQYKMCRALAEKETSLFSGSYVYLEKCRIAKMNIIRRYDNRAEYSDKNGKPIHAVIFPNVYEKESSEFPCSVRYAVYPIYNTEMKLMDAIGTKNEAGCL